MAFDRSAKSVNRLRRQLQRMSAGVGGFIFGDGLAYDPTTGDIAIDLATVSGLEFTSGELRIDLDATSGLALAAAGLSIDLRDTEPGLERSASGLGVLLATDPGLEFSTGLRVMLNGTTLTRGAAGLSVTAPDGVRTVTSIKTGNYVAVVGETVRFDPSGGTFNVTLPTAVGVAGRRVVTKNVTSDVTGITIDTTGGQTIDGAASTPSNTAFDARTFESDGANWMEV